MMLNVLYAGPPGKWQDYDRCLRAACAARGTEIALSDWTDTPDRIDAILYAPTGPLSDFTPFANCRLVQSLWAGVERVVGNQTLTQPLARMVDDGLRLGMTEWVTGHVLRHHLGMDAHIHGQDGIWRNGIVPPLARDRCVAVLGLGELGQAACAALVGLGFHVLGWSRNPRQVPGVGCHHGDTGLRHVLSQAEIVVLLLPATPQTENILDAEALSWLPAGTVIINPGRGTLIDDAALLAALDAGRIGHATLDVFRTEPLPPAHPYWAHPRVTVTPHIAAETRPETAAPVIAENLHRMQTGEPLLYLVDRTRGY